MKPERNVGAPVPPEVRSPSRLSTLRRLGLLDSPAEESFDRLSNLASRILEAPVALVSLVDVNRQFFKSCVGLNEPWQTSRETPLESSFCKHVVGSGTSLVIADAREDPVHQFNQAIPDLGVIAYLGCPLNIDGEILGTFCVIDTSPRRWSEEEIKIVADFASLAVTEIKLRAEAAERAAALEDRDRILAVVCHDLRSPLQTSLTALGLLELDVPSGDASKLIEKLRQSTSYMDHLIEDLLEISTLRFDKFSVDLKPLNINDVVREVAESAVACEEEGGIQTTTSLLPTPDVLADRNRLTRVLLNILDNAMRFTPSGGTIEIACQVQGGEVLVSVSDSGSGISESDLTNIFDWCWHTGHDEKGSTGLGLSIAKGIIDAHGGRIWAQNRDAHGAKFYFALPVAL